MGPCTAEGEIPVDWREWKERLCRTISRKALAAFPAQMPCKTQCDDHCEGDLGNASGEMEIGTMNDVPWLYADNIYSESRIFALDVLDQNQIPDPARSSSALPIDICSPSASDDLPKPDPCVDKWHREMGSRLQELPWTPLGRDGNARYLGQWLGQVRHGHGKLERAGWGNYEGQFVNNKATGSGRFTKTSGVYNGQWLNDRAQGWGSYVHHDGTTYRGQWVSDLKDGTGTETWPDGSSYSGDFQMGMRHGHGTYQVPSDGSMYEGEFRDDMFHGTGQYCFSDGRTYRGEWNMARMHGEGVMLWTDGKLYAGRYIDDKKSGHGRFTWPDGRFYDGQWLRGKQHGSGIFRDKKGRERSGHWKFGQRGFANGDQESSRTPSPEKRGDPRFLRPNAAKEAFASGNLKPKYVLASVQGSLPSALQIDSEVASPINVSIDYEERIIDFDTGTIEEPLEEMEDIGIVPDEDKSILSMYAEHFPETGPTIVDIDQL